MKEIQFSQWSKWTEREDLSGMNYPGIYICIVSNKDLHNSAFSWHPDIAYIGMTNSKKGLKGRLKQFDNTIKGKSGHGGADRFRYKYQNYQDLIKALYISVVSFPCSVKDETSKDLRIMGEVAKCEYDCFAFFKETYGELPEFNNKKISPKYSLNIWQAKKLTST